MTEVNEAIVKLLEKVSEVLQNPDGETITDAQAAIEETLAVLKDAPSEEGEEKEEETGSDEPEDKPEPVGDKGVVDLSVTIAPELPCTWPSPFLPQLVVMPSVQHAPGPYASEAMVIDEHTGTHWDAPPHFIPPPSTGLPFAADIGYVPSDRVPAWKFVGEACVINVENLVEGPGNGLSSLITAEIVKEWERSHRPLGPGDVVLFYSGYSDKYYKPFPEGRRFVSDPLQGLAPAWPGVEPDCMTYLVGQKVGAVGIDSPNIGPASADAIKTHVIGLTNGLILTENLIHLGSLPAVGAFAAVLGPKHASGSGGEARVVAVVEPKISRRLSRSARLQQVVDLSILLREDLPVWWPGVGVGNYSTPYLSRTLHSWEQPGGPALVRTHMLDSHTGTHLVPPSTGKPEPESDEKEYDNHSWRAPEHFAEQEGGIGGSTITADSVPVSQMAGWAHVVDVTHLIGTAEPGKSPVISEADIKQHEKRFGRIEQRQIVIFHTGHSDRFFQPFPYGNRCIADPINGKAEGWPAPGPKTIAYLRGKGVRCIATDAPRMGGAEPAAARATYRAARYAGICLVEYLTSVGELPPTGAYFLFAPVKIKGSHGGYGRALALF